MPIQTSALQHIRPQADGTVRVQERHTDSHGRDWYYAYKATSEAAATALMNARDLTAQLEDAEEADAVKFIAAGGDPAAFVTDDLTATQFNRRMAKRFANGNIDQKFTQSIAPDYQGPLYCRVHYSKASGPVLYVDPKPEIT